MLNRMSIGESILGEAFEAMGWPWRRVQRVAALVLAVGIVAFPVTFRHALLTYADREAQVIGHQLQKALPQPPAPSASR